MYVCGDSDIEFTVRLFLLLTRLEEKTHFNFFLYLLFGSCGATFRTTLGKCFLITKATKFDRGTIKRVQKNGAIKINLREEKRLEKKFPRCDQWAHNDLARKDIFSSNYLFESDTNDESRIYDMETFEFAYVMESNGIADYNCIRFVSDFSNNDYYSNPLVQQNSEMVSKIFKQ